MQKYDVIVVGGGVIGISIAYYTALRGASVLVLERGAVGSGCSHGNSGFLAPSHCDPLPSPGVMARGLRSLLEPENPFYVPLRPDFGLARWLWRFCRSCTERHLYHAEGIFRKLSLESLELHQALGREGADCYQLAQSGALALFTSEPLFIERQEVASRMRTHGIETTVLTGDAVRDLEPLAGPLVIGGLLHRRDGCLDPETFVTWMAEQAKARGATIVPETEVLWAEATRRRIERLTTTCGEFAAEQVVLAAGAWTPHLARTLGVKIPIRAAKGYSLTFPRPEQAPGLPCFLEEARVAVTPYARTLRLAGTLELVGTSLSVDRQRLNTITTQACHYFPQLIDHPAQGIWRGLRPCTPDGLPVLGRLAPYSNLLVAGGHGTKGMLLGPVTGSYLAQMLAGESIGMLERSLRPNRF